MISIFILRQSSSSVPPFIAALTSAPGEIQLLLIKVENIAQEHTKHPVYISITADGTKKFKGPLSKVEGGTAVFNKLVSGIHPLQSHQLTLTFKKKRTWHKNKVITQFFLPVQEISIHGSTEITLPLQDNASKSLSITLRASFVPLSAPETVTEAASESTLESATANIAGVDTAGTPVQQTQTISPVLAAQEAVGNADISLATMHQVSGRLVAGSEQANALPDGVESASEDWGPILKEIIKKTQLFIDAVDQFSEIHPYIKIAWTVFSIIPKTIVRQDAFDESIVRLQTKIAETLEFCLEAHLKTEHAGQKSQGEKLQALFKLITQCGCFISNYTSDKSFTSLSEFAG
ncbi:hypothetical protein ONZ45_g14544 [Pleurotus djamor]|nr:hypothetical protein ONZ45_g14544 [Pleurotus djamor]